MSCGAQTTKPIEINYVLIMMCSLGHTFDLSVTKVESLFISYTMDRDWYKIAKVELTLDWRQCRRFEHELGASHSILI